MAEYFSLSEAGRILSVQPYRVVYALTTGRVKDVPKILGKRAFRRSDLAALAKHFGVQLATPASVPEEESDND